MAEKLSSNFVKHFFDIYRENKKTSYQIQAEMPICTDKNRSGLPSVQCHRGDLKTRRKEMPSHM